MPKTNLPETFPYKRVSIIGPPASGKSTLAEEIARHIGAKYIELDALYWGPNWQAAEPLTFFDQVEDAILETEKWVVAGNYSMTRDLIWENADAVIWLDYSFPLVFWRLMRRTFRRWWTREELWNGNRESLWPQFKVWSQESLLHWFFKIFWRRRREYSLLLLEMKIYKRLKVFRFGAPRETEEWLKNLNF